MVEKQKPIIIKEYSGQQRINISVKLNYKTGDQVAVIPYEDYLNYLNGSAADTSKTIEDLKQQVKDLQEENSRKDTEVNDLTAELKTTKNKLEGIRDKYDELTELNTIYANNHAKDQITNAKLEGELNTANKLINANNLAYSNGLNAMSMAVNSAIDKNNNTLIDNANEIIKKTGFIKRLRGFTITEDDLKTADLKDNLIAAIDEVKKGIDIKQLPENQ